MDKLDVLKSFFEITGSMVGVASISKKTIDLFDEGQIKTVSFNDIPKVVSRRYNLVLNFEKRLIKFLERLDQEKSNFELPVEYNCNDGTLVNLVYSGVKQNDDEFLFIVKKVQSSNAAELDELTKAHKRGYIVDKVNSSIASQSSFALMIIDVDYFKAFNDTYGHMYGDVILIELVAACKKILGDNGHIARIGGDEFLLFVNTEDNYDSVHELCFDLKMDLQKITASNVKGSGITVTIGSAQYPSDGDSFDLLLRKCDKALYRGKKKGRDCFVMYSEEKCGPVSLDGDDIIETKSIDKYTAKNNVYSVITGVNQFLNNEVNFDSGIEDALNLVGNYFYIDRLSVARLDAKSGKIDKHYCWYNPTNIKKYPPRCENEDIPTWAVVLGEKNYLQVDYAPSEGDNFPLKDIFEEDHTKASLAYELVVNGISYGLIRFDMTTGKRHWQPEDYQAFQLIAKLLAMALQKNYIKDVTYKNLYFDPKFNCYNITKFFKDAAEYLVSHKGIMYSVMEFCLTDYIKLRSVIGTKKTLDTVNSIIAILESRDDIIYGKKSEGAFQVLFKHQNKDEIIRLYEDMKKALDAVVESENTPLLSICSGVYFADSSYDTLPNAVELSIITRIENKGAGILFYSDEIKSQALFKSELLYRVDDAVKNDEFLLYLQPKISTHTGKIAGAEALTRWFYKKETLLFPDKFISVLEESGAIAKLDYSVFKSVCKFQRKILDLGKAPIPISVNVSRYVSNFKEYIENIDRIRKEYDINPELIEIEITEGMYYENSNEIVGFITSLHDAGYRVSMDDFGSGYSNFTSLAQLDFDTIKLDKSFCGNLSTEKSKTMLLKIMELVKALNMQTLCEGVETLENVEYLTKVGCDLIQGYYYSKPIPQDDFISKYFN